ncbi:MAG: iron-containing redox enzyme family protein, partial [Nocardiaceae bacterium]|nr:iron-containing redox enzyme family protein [Nocardiaceae bacterium]
MQALTEYAAVSMPVPEPRGELSAALVEALHAHRRPTDLRGPAAGLADRYRDDPREILLDDDAQLVLTMLYELHLAGLSDVDPEWEWNTEILDVRRRLEGPFDAALRSQTEAAVATARSTFGSDVVSTLWQMTAPTTGPGLTEFMAKKADVEQFREFLVHRS